MSLLVHMLLLAVMWTTTPVQATTCEIEVKGYNAPTDDYFESGYIDVNGVRAISFQNESSSGPDPQEGGLWMAAITPACQILDVTRINTEAIYEYNDNYEQIYSSLDAVLFDTYVESWPRGTIFIGASARNVEAIFDVEACENLHSTTNDDTYCNNQRNRYFLAALGLQEKFEVPSGAGLQAQAGGFIVQKGFPHKAQWMYQLDVSSPVTLRGDVSTPDAHVCIPMMPVLPFTNDILYTAEVAVPMQPIRCDGAITAWRFYALVQGQIIFDVWRRGSDGNWMVSASTTITQMDVGENIFCVDDVIEVHVDDYVGVRYPLDYSGDPVLPMSLRRDFDGSAMPNCKQTSEFGLTETDLVPIFFASWMLFDPETDYLLAEVFEKATGDLSGILLGEYDMGVLSFHPYMSSGLLYHCPCVNDTTCATWDRFSTCDNTCQCKSEFMFDDNTLSCVIEDVSSGKPVFASSVEDGHVLSHVVDDNQATDAVNGTCATVAEADRPWLVVDLGQSMRVYGVTLRIPQDQESSAYLADGGCSSGVGIRLTESAATLDVDDTTDCISIVGRGVWLFYSLTDYRGDFVALTAGTYDDPDTQFGSVGSDAISSAMLFDILRVSDSSGLCLSFTGEAAVMSEDCSQQWFLNDAGFFTHLPSLNCLGLASAAAGTPLTLRQCATTIDFSDKVMVINVPGDLCVVKDASNTLITMTYTDIASCLQFTVGPPPLKPVTKTSASLHVPDPEYDYNGYVFWTTITEDISDLGYYHPPCVQLTATDPDNADVDIIVRDISSRTAWFTVGGVGDFTGEIDSFSAEFWEPPLFNFRIGVSDSGSTSGFEPAMFDTCVHYNGNAMSGEELRVSCDRILTGRYVMLYLPGDGFTGQPEAWYHEPEKQRRSFSVCDMDVHALPGHPFGFPCVSDVDCAVPHQDDYLLCEDEMCTCMDGYMPDYNTDTCKDINECLVDNGGCSDTCSNTAGSLVCLCPRFFQLDLDNTTCIDIDECSSGTGGGRADSPACQQLCDNAVFPYQCSCMDGYTLSDDEHTCLDVDECDAAVPPCDVSNGDCLNRLAGFTCLCNAGWELDSDGSTCINVDECLLTNGGCEHVCEDEVGTFTCSCNPGYQLLDDMTSCQERDECVADPCDPSHGVCTNEYGSYSCDCIQGWRITSADANLCEDVDECSENSALCEYGCDNSPGTYTCTCPDDYILADNGFNCLAKDNDECVSSSDDCGDNGVCENPAGRFVCTCLPGYMKTEDNTACEDIDECEEGTSHCEQQCENTQPGYNCVCDGGYVLRNTFYCQDINECEEDSSVCDDLCYNKPGGYDCNCDVGWIYDVVIGNCIDADECAIRNGGCSQVCTNKLGSYECSCLDGYALSANLHDCIDVNECDIPDNCPQSCINLPGSHQCICDAGYDQTADGSCIVLQTCNEGYKFDVDTAGCIDHDECSDGSAVCQHLCINTDGSYECSCRDGYTLVNTRFCDDIDECALSNGGCTEWCTNTGGSYRCACGQGQKVAENGKDCAEDVSDPCASLALRECRACVVEGTTALCRDGDPDLALIIPLAVLGSLFLIAFISLLIMSLLRQRSRRRRKKMAWSETDIMERKKPTYTRTGSYPDPYTTGRAWITEYM